MTILAIDTSTHHGTVALLVDGDLRLDETFTADRRTSAALFPVLERALAAAPDRPVHLMLPSGDFVPAHFHVTEVGRVRKDFIDCGGTVRSSSACVLQVWVADDKDHRLQASKLLDITKAAEALSIEDDLPVEIEYDSGVISQYPVVGAEHTSCGLIFYLGGKHTACLAPQKCGVGGGCC